MDNTELDRSIRDALADLRVDIGKDVTRLETLIEAHRGDVYAHRQMVAAYEPQQQEWNRWRAGIDIKIAAFAGGLTVFAFITSVFGAVIVTRIFH